MWVHITARTHHSINCLTAFTNNAHSMLVCCPRIFTVSSSTIYSDKGPLNLLLFDIYSWNQYDTKGKTLFELFDPILFDLLSISQCFYLRLESYPVTCFFIVLNMSFYDLDSSHKVKNLYHPVCSMPYVNICRQKSCIKKIVSNDREMDWLLRIERKRPSVAWANSLQNGW